MKRILSLLLSLVMVAGMLPQNVVATENPCNHIHDDSCYTVKCAHVHGECGYVEGDPEIPCDHDCTQDVACAERVLACTHVHDESCRYTEAKEDQAPEGTTAPDEAIGSGTPDSTAPVLHGMAFSSTMVNAPGAVEFTINASDDISGVDYVELLFTCQETGKEIKCGATKDYYDKELGKMVLYADGLFHGALEFDGYVESGVFTADYIFLRDVAGNSITYIPAEDDPGNNQASMPEEIRKMSVTVLRSETVDTKPPVLNQIFFYPESVESLAEIEIVIDAT